MNILRQLKERPSSLSSWSAGLREQNLSIFTLVAMAMTSMIGVPYFVCDLIVHLVVQGPLVWFDKVSA